MDDYRLTFRGFVRLRGVGSVDRIAGSLYGLAFGDVLGRPAEFLTLADIDLDGRTTWWARR
ncbi:hypothetical protein SK854_42195 [Lentzea sp. BCCO 10_0061]|uniref:ADP-ribosylglycohydrolase n=1 Tax=Lentzea sokolovensis TaxID=3095429 RepID=A0ABU4VCZ2_9PSEU|nr:hypothetical protein [Lentzea sp. BCCO 10_0061]MDX8148788.1 hypothetical protein [Lentzea sp. BCCO 10_0061]